MRRPGRGGGALIRYEAEVPRELPDAACAGAVETLFPELSPRQAREAFRARDVKLNGRRVGPDEPAPCGAILTVFAGEAERKADVVFEDKEYLVLNKRQGLPTQGPGSAETLCARHCGAPVFACHRLDAQTGGLLLLAKDTRALETAVAAFAARKVHKTYRCLARGVPSPEEATLRGFLVKDAQAAHVRVLDAPAPGALPIETRYRVLACEGELSRLEVVIPTGRTHQIRAHLAHIGHPILGDDKYGDRALNRRLGARGQRLWAVRLELWDGRVFETAEPF